MTPPHSSPMVECQHCGWRGASSECRKLVWCAGMELECPFCRSIFPSKSASGEQRATSVWVSAELNRIIKIKSGTE